MRRTTTLAAASALGLALLAPAVTATAAAPTCRGEAATLVGTAPTLTGTEGRDVIVTGTASDVHALGGDDLVCVTEGASSNVLSVSAGTGADVVDTSALPGGYVTTDLGTGADTFVGGAGNDTVTTGFADPANGADHETDTVSTGGGDDRVVMTPDWRDTTDVVDLGPGDDRVSWSSFGMAPGASLAGGEGQDRLRLDFVDDGTGLLDLAAGIVRKTGPQGGTATGRFSSFEAADVTASSTGSGASVPGLIEVRGTSEADEVQVAFDISYGSSRLAVDTLGGDDRVLVHGHPLLPGSRIATGRGVDELVVASPDGSLALDLGRDLLRTRRDHPYLSDAVVRTTVADVEDAFLMAPRVRLTGDRRANRLAFNGCRGTLRGGAGRDALTTIGGDPWFDTYSYDCRARATMAGGGGNDELRGGTGRDRLRGNAGTDRLAGRNGNDVLLGGPGRDRADGGNGRDRCRAERERRCER